MLDLIITKAVIAAIGVSISAGILGCFVIWNRMAYFGDAVSHSALLGIALGVLFAVNVDFLIILVCLLFGILLAWLKNNHYLTTDSVLGVLAHSSLGLGMLIISFANIGGDDVGHKIDIHNFLFGDILTISDLNLTIILISALIITTLISLKWQPLCLTTICRDIARAEKINVFHMDLLLITLLCLFVGISIKIFGVLLVTSMLIIPSSTARQVATSPKLMAIFSIFFATISSIVGIFLAIIYKIDSGPVIVVCCSFILLLVSLFKFCKIRLKA